MVPPCAFPFSSPFSFTHHSCSPPSRRLVLPCVRTADSPLWISEACLSSGGSPALNACERRGLSCLSTLMHPNARPRAQPPPGVAARDQPQHPLLAPSAACLVLPRVPTASILFRHPQQHAWGAGGSPALLARSLWHSPCCSTLCTPCIPLLRLRLVSPRAPTASSHCGSPSSPPGALRNALRCRLALCSAVPVFRPFLHPLYTPPRPAVS